MKTLTLDECRAAWRAQPTTLHGVTVEAVSQAPEGWRVRYRAAQGGPRAAVLRDGGPALYAGWRGTLVVRAGVITAAHEAA
jgi:hypothetical protein